MASLKGGLLKRANSKFGDVFIKQYHLWRNCLESTPEQRQALETAGNEKYKFTDVVKYAQAILADEKRKRSVYRK